MTLTDTVSRLSTQAPPSPAQAPPASAPPASPAPPQDSVSVSQPAPASTAPASGPTPRQERMSTFVRDAQLSALDQTKYITATWMGELVGMAVGGAVMAPIGLALGNLYYITGGTAILGGLGALAGYAAEKYHLGNKIAGAFRKMTGQAEPAAGSGTAAPPASPGAATPAAGASPRTPVPLKAAATAGMIVGGIARATPKIVYPVIKSATAAEKAMILRALDAMPLMDVTSTSQIAVVNGLEELGASGMAQPLYYRNQIMLGHESMGYGEFGYTTTIHEVGHTLDFSRGFGPIGSNSQFGPYGKGPYWFDPNVDSPGSPPYSATNRFEDFAQTHMAYHTEPGKLKELTPTKFEAMDEMHQPGAMDRLLDRPGVRKVGREMGEATGRVPFLREGLDLASALIAPGVLHNGATHLENALRTGDPVERFDGKMRLAAGFSYMFKTAAPLGLVASTMHWLYSKRVREGTMTAEEANKKADKWLAVSMGPIGTTGMAAVKQLESEGVDATKAAPAGVASKKPPEFLTGIAGTMIGSYVGQTAGALIGTALGGVQGAVAGAWWGKVGGALVGLGAVSAAKAFRARGAAASAGLTGRDKLHLAGVLGGSAIGGTLGTVAGGYAGSTLGALAGGAVGGPVGAAVGSFAGRVAGVIVLSYAGAKLGAKAGSKIAPDDGT